MGFAFRRCRWFTATMWNMRLLRTPCTAIRILTAMVKGRWGKENEVGV